MSFKVKSKLLKDAFNYNAGNRNNDLSLKSFGLSGDPALEVAGSPPAYKRKSPT